MQAPWRVSSPIASDYGAENDPVSSISTFINVRGSLSLPCVLAIEVDMVAIQLRSPAKKRDLKPSW